MPAVLMRKFRESRIASSSSMTWTTASDGIVIVRVLLGHRAKGETEHRAAARIGLRPDASAVSFDDRARDRQPHSHAVTFRGHERLEELRRDLVRDSRPGIGYADDCRAILARCGGQDKLAMRRLLHGFDRVAYQVEQHLLHLDLVGEHQIERRIKPERDTHALILGSDECEGACLLDELLDALDAPLAFAARDEIA